MSVKRALIAAALVAGSLAGSPPAAVAHNEIVIAGQQIAPSGHVNGYGVAPGAWIDDGPATDGVFIWTNADPFDYKFSGRCITPALCGTRAFRVTAKALDDTVYCGSALAKGTYEYSDPAFPTMKARVRIVVDTIDCGA